jgi:hypothetical protein
MIFLNNSPLEVATLEFPIMINGADKTGASYFSIELLTEMYAHGEHILFFSGYEMAKSSFKEKVGDSFDERRVIILEDANETQLLSALQTLPDISSHTIYIKNFDLYAPTTIQEVLKFPKLLFMGNIDLAKAKNEIKQHNWGTKISFGFPEVEKYYGVIESARLNGQVHIE